MIHNKIKLSLIAALACTTLSGCMTTQKTHSYFGAQQNQFRAGPKGGVDRIWTPNDIQNRADLNAILSKYNSVMIDPILVSLTDKQAYDGLNPQELYALTAEFRKALSINLQDRYPIVKTPGPNTLRLKVGLTGVETPYRLLAATSTFMPVGLGVSTASKIITGEHTNVGSASMEIAVSDSQSGKVIFAAIDRRAGGKSPEKILDTKSDARKAFYWWAQRLRITLDKAYNAE